MCLPKFGTEMETSLWIEKRLLETNLHISNAHEEPQKSVSAAAEGTQTGQGAPTALSKKISLAK